MRQFQYCLETIKKSRRITVMSFFEHSSVDSSIKRLITSIHWPLFVLIGIGIIGHSMFLSAPFVNLEYIYQQSAELVTSGQGFKRSLLHLFEGFNNPLGNTLVIAGVQGIIGGSELSSRLPSLVSWLICVSMVYLIGCRWWSLSVGALAATIIGFSPLFWVYGGIAYPDVPFTALITITMFLAGFATYRNSLRWHLLAALLLGLSTLFRYNGILFFPAIAIYVALQMYTTHSSNDINNWKSDTLKVWLVYIVVCGTIVIPYLLWTQQVLGMVFRPGFVLVAPTDIIFHVAASVPRLGGYLIWLGAFVLPFTFLTFEHIRVRIKRPSLFMVAAILIPLNVAIIGAVHYLEITSGELFGEMAFGWLERLLPTFIIVVMRFVFLTASEVAVVGLIVWGRQKVWPNAFMVLWLLVPLLIHSFYRMSQRYVMFFLPPLAVYMAWLVVKSVTLSKHRTTAIALCIVYMIIYPSIGLFTSAYYSAEGHASADIAEYVNENKINIAASRHNPVLTNSFYLIDESRFPESDLSINHRVAALGRYEDIENAIYVRDVRVIGLLIKRYVVLPLS